MANINNILSRERINERIIYLYACGERWYAYEHSAYHFLQTFKTGEVTKRENYICLEIVPQLEFLNSTIMCSVEVVLVGDDQIVMDCNTVFPDFEQWKQMCVN